MKKIIFFFILIFSFQFCKSQTVYFYTTRTSFIHNVAAKIYYQNKQLYKLHENQWVKHVFSNVSSAKFIVRSGTYFSKKSIHLNFSNNNSIAVVKIEFGKTMWYVYEESYKFLPIAIKEDIRQHLHAEELDKRTQNHPRTNWTEASLKEKFGTENMDNIQGIYENSFSQDKIKMKLGIVNIKGQYKIIFLSSRNPKVNQIWKDGDVKANLIATATPLFYKVKWYMADKSINEDCFVLMKNNLFKFLMPDGKEEVFIKLFPTYSKSQKNTNVSSGTGFAINKDGLIATNHHVIAGGKNILVRGINGDFSYPYQAEVVADDEKNDLAIIKITDGNFNSIDDIPYGFSKKIEDVGSEVFTLGFPLRSTMGNEVKLTNGIVSANSGFEGDITAYQISVPVQPGNSGGPLFDRKGKLIGIVNAKHTGAENVTYAIKSLYLNNLIQSLGIKTNDVSNRSKLKLFDLSQQVKVLKNFVYMIESR